MRILIVGGGVAGVAVATKLRRLDENADIIIFEKGENLGVASCALPDYFVGNIENKEDISTDVEYMRNRFNINAHINTEVVSINRKEKSVKLENGNVEYYDKLILAMGAIQMRPDINGILNENIFAIRGIESVDLIRDYIFYADVKTALIIGGGHIAIEMAQALIKFKVKPIIVEKSTHLFPFMDFDTAASAENYLRKNGVEIYTQTEVVKITETEAWLTNGNNLKHDMVIVATGVTPALKLPIIAGLDIGDDGGIKVNEFMQTNDKDIYAIGDNAEIMKLVTKNYKRISHAGIAIKEANVVAENIARIKMKMEPVVETCITKIFDYTIGGVGTTEDELLKNNMLYNKIHIWGDANAVNSDEILLKLLFDKKGKVLGAQCWGKSGVDKRLDVISAIIQKNGNIDDLISYEICYSPPYSNAKDIINIIGSQAKAILNKTIKMAYYHDLQKKDVFLVDIRMPVFFEEEHIKNAINIPISAIRSNLSSFPADKRIILYCNSGYGAYYAACILHNRGFDNVYILDGSLKLYKELNDICKKNTCKF